MAFNVIEKRFKEYDGIKVYLEDEGIHLEFLKDKYVKYITVYLKRKYNYLPLEDIFAGARFYSDLAEELRKKDVECLSKKNTSYRSYRRMQNVLRGSKKPKNMEEMKKCVNFVKDMENLFDIKLLSNPEEKALKNNEYINSLIVPLLDIMIDSDFYYYIPNSNKSTAYRCYWNQIKMIENNIAILYKEEENYETLKLWQKILEPLRKIIGNGDDDDDSYPGGDFPGVTSKIWLDANPVLAYFDCVYDIAEKNYQLYESINAGRYGKLHFSFTIGKDELEVKENINKRKNYFRSQGIRDGFEDNFEKEKRVFFIEFRKAYMKIVKQYMHIDSV